MTIDKWDKEEIKKLARVSGKPLEVQSAEVFLKRGWRVRIGTFYTDAASEKIRELDFMAERNDPISAQNVNRDLIDWNLRLRILGSCKGFPQEHGPVMYSVASNNRSLEKPNFICYECGIHGRSVAESMRQRSASRFLHVAGLSSARQIVGFDVFQCKEDNKDQNRFEYLRKGDRDVYEGLDSAIKAAIFWQQEDQRQNRRRIGEANRANITINIPLLVLSYPFWDVAIDQGAQGEPELKSSGFHVSLYPSADKERPPEPIMSIIWEASKLEELTHNLYGLFEFLSDEVESAVQKI